MAGIIAVIYERRTMLEAWVQEQPFKKVSLRDNKAVGMDGTVYKFFSTEHPGFIRGLLFTGVVTLGIVTKEAHDAYCAGRMYG